MVGVVWVVVAVDATVGIPSNYSVCVWEVLNQNNVTLQYSCAGNMTYTVNRTAGGMQTQSFSLCPTKN